MRQGDTLKELIGLLRHVGKQAAEEARGGLLMGKQAKLLQGKRRASLQLHVAEVPCLSRSKQRGKQ